MHRYLHVILLILFTLLSQGCSSTENTDEAFVLETPQIESTTSSPESNVSEIIVHGQAGAAVYVNGKQVATINQEGTAVITLEMPQDEASGVATLVLKDEAGNESEPVVFTLTHENSQTPDVNSSEEDNKQENNNSTDNGDGNVSVDDDNGSVTTPPVTTPHPAIITLTSLTLTADNTTLSKDTNTTVKVMATFSDNSRKEVTQQVTWNMTPKNALRMNNRNLQAVNDGNITLQATLGNKHSNILHVNVFWEIHGYRLPPMPDEKLNNATLLGIDSNNNGVRDDVERWIYETYDTYIPCVEKVIYVDVTLTSGEIKRVKSYEDVCEDKAVPYHQIVREIAMQGARAAQIIIVEPKKARETTKFMDAAQNCYFYFSTAAERQGEPILVPERVNILGKEFDAIQFNTVQRARAYGEYNFALSGGVYSANETDEELRQGCDFDVDALLGK